MKLSGAWLGLLWTLCACTEAPRGPRYDGAGHQSPRHGGTLTFYHSSGVRTLDPHIAYDELSIIAVRYLFDGLLDYDEHGRVVASLAELPQVSDGGRRFSFRLRRGVRFHNGREMTSEDVRWSLERMLHPDSASPGVNFFTNLGGLHEYRAGNTKHIAGIRVTDRYGIEFQLRHPDQTFLNVMAMTFAYPVPAENYARYGRGVAQHPVGTGPFRLASWERSVRLVFERHRQYWRPGLPYLDRVIYLENVERDVAVMRFRNGDVDHAHRFTLPDRLFFERSPQWSPYVARYAEADIWGITLNCQMFPFDNVHVRRAVAAAIDRERWSRARNGLLRPTGQPIPPGIVGYSAQLIDQQRYDLRLARREMRLAGLPRGVTEPITLWTDDRAGSQLYGELAQADLAKIGIRLRLKPVAFPIYLEEVGKPRRVQAAISGWAQDFPDPTSFFDILFHGRAIHPSNSDNHSFYRSPQLDQLLDAARIEADKPRRRAMYERAGSIVARDAPWAFLWNNRGLEVWQPYVRGYRRNPVWRFDMRYVWLDLPRRKRGLR